MIKRLRLKFVLINMSIVLLMLCVIFALVFHFTRANLEQKSLDMMQNIAEHPLQAVFPSATYDNVNLPYIAIQLGPRGELTTVSGGYFQLSDDRLLDQLIREALRSSRAFGVLEEYNLRYFRLKTPASHCLVFADISSEVTTLNSLIKNCALIGAISFAVFLAASILLSGWAVRPVEQAWMQQRQFVADASHELKTPLTVIMTNAELAQSMEYDEVRRGKFLEGIASMSRQMRALVEEMLELARADQARPAEMETLDLSKVVSDALLPFEPVFFESGRSLSSRVDEGLRMRGSYSGLTQLLEVLLDNARKYSREGGNTQVTLEKRRRSRCLLTVADEGDPIPQEELRNIFKRFYRADPARSRTGSFGLGLSIAESITKQHRGRIWAESRDGVNSFCVELPCL